MKLIGLTGGIASGKSTVTQMLRKAGFKVVCADEISREICKKGNAGYFAIQKEFGLGFFSSDDELDRKKLGAYVFSDKEALKKLNALLHPIILQAIRDKTRNVQDVCFVDAALLIETGLYKDMDEIWLVAADEQIRMERLAKRDDLTWEQAKLRFSAQMPENERRKYAKQVIDNSGNLEDTAKQVEKLIQSLKRTE